MTKTFIKTIGTAKNVVIKNGKTRTNDVKWNAKYNGKNAKIKLNLNDNGNKKKYVVNMDNEDLANMSSLDLLAKIANSRLTPFATIIRARQDIQKNNEELKGSEFGKRKKTVNLPLFKVNIREK